MKRKLGDISYLYRLLKQTIQIFTNDTNNTLFVTFVWLKIQIGVYTQQQAHSAKWTIHSTEWGPIRPNRVSFVVFSKFEAEHLMSMLPFDRIHKSFGRLKGHLVKWSRIHPFQQFAVHCAWVAWCIRPNMYSIWPNGAQFGKTLKIQSTKFSNTND